mgnify:FL=1
MQNNPQQLSVHELLAGDTHYVIPVYQRNYAWEEGEITQFIQDITDYLPGGRPYYIGTLIIYGRKDENRQSSEVIDGQQRLTTLSLLASYLKNTLPEGLAWYKNLNIEFDNRRNSQVTFQALFKGGSSQNIPDPALINTGILNGYQLIEKILPLIIREHHLTLKQFSDYLFNSVTIMQVQVPDDTDLNHYFEIMNSRGEQLEKHEILKAQLMEKLPGYEHTLSIIWESCAGMQRYVQMGFTPEQRHNIFGKNDWGRFTATNFDALHTLLNKEHTHAQPQSVSLTDLITNTFTRTDQPENSREEDTERFNSVINFPNFLLHVLRITLRKTIPLDDKRLLETFKEHLFSADDPAAFIKLFFFNLLRCKYLFDQYVIKREYGSAGESWSLKRLTWSESGAYYVSSFSQKPEETDDINHTLLMLLSAFHVSAPTQVYKYWLHAALTHLFDSQAPTGADYLKHMHATGTAFLFDRFLTPDNERAYFDIIDTPVCKTRADTVSVSTLTPMLRYGHIKNNFVFNFLDYLLWLRNKENDAHIRAFDFTFRSSVEHYFPRNPRFESDKIHADVCDSFGNLCLISAEKNSSLGNLLPAEKQKEYKNKPADSIKQYLMMKEATWDENAIQHHTQTMTEALLLCLAGQTDH